MTQAVENTDSYYVANGATTTFGFDFSANASGEVIVLTNGATASGYTISKSFPFTGGANVVFSVAPANGVKIAILRKTELSQEVNFDSTTAFLEADHEAALDKMVRGQQDLARDVREKTLRLGDADSGFTNGFNVPKPVSGDENKLVALNDNDPPDGFEYFENTIGDISDAVAAAEAAQAAAELAETNAETAETNAETAASTATTQAGIATAQAGIATTQAGLASNSAGEASAIANGSLNTYTLLPSGTWNPTLSGEAKQITGTTTINLPAPAANFRIHYHVVGNQTVTVNRNGSEDIIIGTQTFTDDVRSSEYGFFTITCLNGASYVITKSNTTDIYAEAPTGADGASGEGVPAGGTTGQVLAKIDGTDYNTQWTTVSGTGDVVGPASSTDNAVARFDTTTGKLVQNSAVTIDDSGNIATSGTVDGRDVSVDGTKLDGIEAGADVTDTTNVTAAGALMDSEVTNLAQVKAFDSTDYATAAQGTLADSALQSADIGVSVQAHSAVLDATTASFTTADETKLDGIETGADVTDAANVNAAGAVMNSDYTPAHSLLVQQSGTGSPSSLAISNNSFIGKQTGDIAPLSTTTARTMLDILDPPIIIACSDETTAITTGTGKVTFRMPYAFTLTGVRASVTTAPTGSTIIIDINENGTSILSTKLSIDATEKTSTTAASAAVISDTALANDSEITIDFDQVGSTIAGAGVKVYLIGTKG